MKLLTFPFGGIFQEYKDRDGLFLDAVYILCMEDKPKPKLDI